MKIKHILSISISFILALSSPLSADGQRKSHQSHPTTRTSATEISGMWLDDARPSISTNDYTLIYGVELKAPGYIGKALTCAIAPLDHTDDFHGNDLLAFYTEVNITTGGKATAAIEVPLSKIIPDNDNESYKMAVILYDSNGEPIDLECFILSGQALAETCNNSAGESAQNFVLGMVEAAHQGSATGLSWVDDYGKKHPHQHLITCRVCNGTGDCPDKYSESHLDGKCLSCDNSGRCKTCSGMGHFENPHFKLK